MKFQANARGRTLFALLALAVIAMGQFVWAQNLGSAPASNVAQSEKDRRARSQKVRF